MIEEEKPGGDTAASPVAPGPGPAAAGLPPTKPTMLKPTSLSQTLRNAAHKIYKRAFLEFILREKPLRPSKDGRHIPLDPTRPQPLVDSRRGNSYLDNSVRTSRYTVYDFFPKQLIFQFSRIGNFYFLCVGVPQTIPGLSTTGNFTTIVPLMVFVLLTILKEGFDDYRRHRLDNVENANAVMVLKEASKARPHAVVVKRWTTRFPFLHKTEEPIREFDEEYDGFKWVSTKWSDVRVGDVLKLTRDESVPADIVLLHADGENDLAYIETMALDGETNLKSKQVSAAIKDCDSIKGILSCPAHFVTEDPNPELYRFDGRVTVGEKTLPLTLNEVIYRGSILRNTPSVTGLVVNTGEESKFRMNANQHPQAKRPALERVANRIVLTLALYVVVLSVGCSMGYVAWQKSFESHSWYLKDAKVPFHEILIAYIIQFNNVIPLALYVSLEIVKIGQMLMLNSDIEMYDEATDTPARCNTNNILENLGQVGYVFSDKTGTLTENVMKFRKLSIAGTAWLHEVDLESDGLTKTRTGEGSHGDIELSTLGRKTSHFSTHRKPALSTTASSESSEALHKLPSLTRAVSAGQRRSSSQWRSSGRPLNVQPDVTTSDLTEYIQARPNSLFARKAKQYLLAMALCHTCLPEMRNGTIDFQSSSPDELAIVKAAQELGYSVVKRSPQSITLRVSGENGSSDLQTFEILDVIEFSTKRKRMSVIVRYPDGRIAIICKGADSVILPRLKMAGLAKQKATEVRKSADLEHELARRSLQESRPSLGGQRPSISGQRPSIGGPRTSIAGRLGAGASFLDPNHGLGQPDVRSKSFEMGARPQCDDRDDRPRPSLTTRGKSFELSKYVVLHTPDQDSPDVTDNRLDFLDDPYIHDDPTVFSRCFKHLDDFAAEGLRTLVFAQRFIPEAEYTTWKATFEKASTSITNRQDLIESAAESIELSLDLVGASAIEDKLQEGVPDTIDRLRRANIHIWMLTGDKRETAINIAHSARICQPGSDLYIIDSTKGSLDSQLQTVLEDIQSESVHSVVVIDGHTLGIIEQSDELSEQFYAVMPLVDSVICCRASPAQKALLVRTVRTRLRKSKTASNRGLTLAIGDGANDLAMIQSSHVGIGISGKEGLQAARVADYSISQFRFLERLLLVHGRWNYVRTAKFILLTFWKEMFFYLPTAIYQRYNGYTGTSLYEYASLTVFNTLFTSLAVICMGIWEQDLKAETLLAVPELYVCGQKNMGLNMWKYVGWMVIAATDGVLMWFGVWAGYGWTARYSDQGLFAIGNLAFTVGVLWINWRLLMVGLEPGTGGQLRAGASIYAVRDGITKTYGRDALWWATLFGVLGVLGMIEMTRRIVKRVLVGMGLWRWGVWGEVGEGLDVEVWQELEKDPVVWERLKRLAAGKGEEDEEEVEGGEA
ncbi:related to ATPases [Cephalotrichum gorgonifer]|uniref:Phospholipid-transporting ATPase n=1 Tax=Cephalotrichum gorgonifer TaxID=2041049 RepID=A0AAE8SX22_9PEZI|nr:related to ATPases [Cephalotrichum gorgonifer]